MTLAIDQEQDASNYRTDAGDEGYDRSADIHTQQHQTLQDQKYGKQYPFESFHVHFDLSFEFILDRIAIYKERGTLPLSV
jgi:hypothetical protein